MAKTLRSRIAAVAVAALGAGLLVAVSPANAAVTATVTLPSAVRAGAGAPDVTFTINNTSDAAANLGLVALAVPASSDTPVAQTSATLANAVAVAAEDSEDVTVSPGTTALDLPGVYTIGVFKSASTTSYTAGDTIVTTFSLTVGGAASSFALTSGSTAIGGYVKLAASYKDAAGRSTLPLSTESLTLTNAGAVTISASASSGYGASLALTGATVASATSFYVKGVTAGTATVAGALSTNGVATGSSTVTVVATAAESALVAAAPKATLTSSVNYGIVATTTAGTYKARKLTAQTLTAKVAGLPANSGVAVDVTWNGASGAFATSNPVVVTDASGVATVSISVAATAAGTKVGTLTIGTTPTTVLTVNFVDSGAKTLDVTPANIVVSPGASTTFTATASADDVFGNLPADTTRLYMGVGSAIYATSLTKNGVAAFTFTAPATAGDVTVKFSDAVALSGGNYNTTVVVHVTTSGTATSLTLTDSDTSTGTATDDNASTRAIVLTPANVSGTAANTDNAVEVTVTTASPSALPFTATAVAGSGLRLFTSTPAGSALAAGKTTVTGTAGTTSIFAVPTKVGAATFTVTAGGLTKTFTVTGKLATGAKAQLITLTKGTVSAGKVNYQIKTTDIFGNPVSATVDLVLSGVGTLSNGFKSHTLTTSTAGTNEFDVLSATAGSATITATIQDASYTAVTSTQATAQSISASAQSASDTVAITAAVDPLDAVKAQVTTLQTTITSIQTAIATLVASISATLTVMQSAINKIVKKLKIK